MSECARGRKACDVEIDELKAALAGRRKEHHQHLEDKLLLRKERDAFMEVLQNIATFDCPMTHSRPIKFGCGCTAHQAWAVLKTFNMPTKKSPDQPRRVLTRL